MAFILTNVGHITISPSYPSHTPLIPCRQWRGPSVLAAVPFCKTIIRVLPPSCSTTSSSEFPSQPTTNHPSSQPDHNISNEKRFPNGPNRNESKGIKNTRHRKHKKFTNKATIRYPDSAYRTSAPTEGRDWRVNFAQRKEEKDIEHHRDNSQQPPPPPPPQQQPYRRTFPLAGDETGQGHRPTQKIINNIAKKLEQKKKRVDALTDINITSQAPTNIQDQDPNHQTHDRSDAKSKSIRPPHVYKELDEAYSKEKKYYSGAMPPKPTWFPSHPINSKTNLPMVRVLILGSGIRSNTKIATILRDSGLVCGTYYAQAPQHINQCDLNMKKVGANVVPGLSAYDIDGIVEFCRWARVDVVIALPEYENGQDAFRYSDNEDNDSAVHHEHDDDHHHQDYFHTWPHSSSDSDIDVDDIEKMMMISQQQDRQQSDSSVRGDEFDNPWDLQSNNRVGTELEKKLAELNVTYFSGDLTAWLLDGHITLENFFSDIIDQIKRTIEEEDDVRLG